MTASNAGFDSFLVHHIYKKAAKNETNCEAQEHFILINTIKLSYIFPAEHIQRC